MTGLVMLAFHVFPGGVPAALGMFFTIITLLGLTVVFYALYVAHRAESAGLSLAGLVLWLLVFVLNLFVPFWRTFLKKRTLTCQET